MKVMSINCQNNAVNRQGGRGLEGYDYSLMLANHIIDNEYDLVGTQEMSYRFTEKLKSYLPNYLFSGKYRNKLAIFKKLIPKLQGLIENNNVISKDQVMYEKTFTLPWFPHSFKDIKYAIKRKSLMRRIATVVLINTKELGYIYIVNTHLDYALKSIQERQLEKLYQAINKYRKEYPVILTGDFNMEYMNPIFESFIHKLENIGIKRVPIDDKTDALKYRHKSAIDHIFIPSEYEVMDSGTVKDENIRGVTDHLAVYVEFKKVEL